MFNIRAVSIETRNDFDKVLTSVRRWEEIAEEKMGLVRVPKARSTWDDYAMIASTITPSVYNTLCRKERTMFVAERESLEGIALVEWMQNGIKLNGVLKNPENFRSGAGEALIEYIFKECVDNKMDEVITSALPLEVPFYERLGFEKLEASCSGKDCNMRITAKKLGEIGWV